jgi:hypothetical protein
MEEKLEQCKNGEFDDNELIDLVLHYERENSILMQENQRLANENAKLNHYKGLYQDVKRRNSKAIEWINEHIEENNCGDITIIDWNQLSNPKYLLQILKEESND